MTEPEWTETLSDAGRTEGDTHGGPAAPCWLRSDTRMTSPLRGRVTAGAWGQWRGGSAGQGGPSHRGPSRSRETAWALSAQGDSPLVDQHPDTLSSWPGLGRLLPAPEEGLEPPLTLWVHFRSQSLGAPGWACFPAEPLWGSQGWGVGSTLSPCFFAERPCVVFSGDPRTASCV